MTRILWGRTEEMQRAFYIRQLGLSGGFEYGDYVRAALADGTTPNGVFGARVMWGTRDEIVSRLGTVYAEIAGQDLALLTRAFGALRFVHLVRRDHVAQAVSWARAEQTHFWHDGDRALPGVNPRFDFDQIHGLAQTIETHNTAWRRWFDRVEVTPHVVDYDQLVSDPVGAVRQILASLGVPLVPERPITSERQRQAESLNDEWIRRYSDARALLQRRSDDSS